MIRLLALTLFVAYPAFAEVSVQDLDPARSKLSFLLTTPLGEIDGEFRNVQGVLQIDERNPLQAKAIITVDIARAIIGNDATFVSKLFQSLPSLPVRFETKEILKAKKGTVVKGQAKLRDEVRNVSAPAVIQAGKKESSIRFEATGSLENSFQAIPPLLAQGNGRLFGTLVFSKKR